MKDSLKKIQGNTYCIDLDGTCTGIYKLDQSHLVLIDSGGKENPDFIRWIKASGYTVDAVIHTHIHIDHIGCSMLADKEFGSRLIATQGEEIIPRYKERGIDFDIERINAGDSIKVRDAVFRTVPTPGHSPDHIMVITPDNVGFVGDAIISEGYLNRSRFPYMLMPKEAIESMENIRNAGIDYGVCAHNGFVGAKELDRLIDLNRDKHVMLFELLRRTIREEQPVTVEEAMDKFMINAGVYNAEIRGYGYMLETARGRIDDLVEAGEFQLVNGILYGR